MTRSLIDQLINLGEELKENKERAQKADSEKIIYHAELDRLGAPRENISGSTLTIYGRLSALAPEQVVLQPGMSVDGSGRIIKR